MFFFYYSLQDLHALLREARVVSPATFWGIIHGGLEEAGVPS